MAEAKWYVVHTYSGYENKVKANIDKTIENRHLEDEILEVRVPMQEVVELKNGVQKASQKKMFPGYVLIHMIMNDDTWYVVRNTRGVTGFVGPGSKPVPLTDEEMAPLGIQKEDIVVDFEEGDTVTVTGGAWEGTVGMIQTINMAKQSLTINVDLFGRETPVEISFAPASELLKRINPKAEITCDNAHYTQLPKGWSVAPMQILCSLIDGNKQNGIERINLDVKYLRGEREPKTLTSGKFIPANSLLILVDGENSGEVFRTPIEGYQGSTFKQLSINENMNTEYLLQVINFYRKLLRENKIGSTIPHLNKKLFKEIKVSIPPYKEQQRIVDSINKAFMFLDMIMENL